jgi:UDP-3-O-[3-hydroxymyristoyl] glucosamine N-acyltransferase LpxD
MDKFLTTGIAANFLNGCLIGVDNTITGVCTLNSPAPGAIAFAKSWEKVESAGLERVSTSILILPKEAAEQASQIESVILVDNPRLAFAQLLAEYFQPRPSHTITESARLGDNVKIGENVTVGEYCVIGDGVVIGDGTEIRHHVVIGRNVKIGKYCFIKSHSVIGEEGFGIEKNEEGWNIRVPHIGSAVIGDNVEIGAFNTVCSGTVEPTIIGDYVKTDDHVHIAHNCRIGKNTILTACSEISGSVTIGQDVWLSPNCAINNGLNIADEAFVGIGAVVTKDCGAGGVYAGSPARLIRQRADK